MAVFRRTVIFFSVLIGLILILQSCNKVDSPVSSSGSNTSDRLPKNFICVTVYNCLSGEAMEGALVQIKDGNGNVLFQGQTNSSGMICFSVGLLADGTYSAEASYGLSFAQQKFEYSQDMAQPVNVSLCVSPPF